uniref:G-protein coupled receptors family 1 profile domain-containing protein n=1 Tax=Plectus sambesii TaxID=2011161 RepID=A0A914VK09_9BILA
MYVSDNLTIAEENSTIEAVNNDGSQLLCAAYDEYTTLRFGLIVGASVFAIIGATTNIILIRIFIVLSISSAQDQKWNPSRLYLIALAVCDAFLCISFILIFGLDAVAIYTRNYFSHWFYFQTIIVVFFGARLAQMLIPYFLIVATFERWVLAYNLQGYRFLKFYTKNRTKYWATLVVCGLAISLRLPMAFAFFIRHFDDCPDVFGRRQLWPTSVFFLPEYQILDFYVVSAVQVFVPFAALTSLNGMIVHKLTKKTTVLSTNTATNSHSPALVKSEEEARSQSTRSAPTIDYQIEIRLNSLPDQEAFSTQMNGFVLSRPRIQKRPLQKLFSGFRTKSLNIDLGEKRRSRRLSSATRVRRAKVREATNTMLAIVTVYLMCNTPHFILTLLEQFNSTVLRDENGASTQFYMAMSDLVSVLFMISSFVRIFVYLKCNQEVRFEFRRILGML